jgi:DNA-binding Lrp family transcriptional regulator
MKPIDYELIAHIRSDARMPIPAIAKATGIPSSTIYEKMKRQFKGVFKKHIALLNFNELGYHSVVHFAISCRESDRQELKSFLMEHPRINSLHRVNFGWDFLAEGIFKDLGEAEDFKTLLRGRFSPRQMECFSVVEELKKESFLTSAKHINE